MATKKNKWKKKTNLKELFEKRLYQKWDWSSPLVWAWATLNPIRYKWPKKTDDLISKIGKWWNKQEEKLSHWVADHWGTIANVGSTLTLLIPWGRIIKAWKYAGKIWRFLWKMWNKFKIFGKAKKTWWNEVIQTTNKSKGLIKNTGEGVNKKEIKNISTEKTTAIVPVVNNTTKKSLLWRWWQYIKNNKWKSFIWWTVWLIVWTAGYQSLKDYLRKSDDNTNKQKSWQNNLTWTNQVNNNQINNQTNNNQVNNQINNKNVNNQQKTNKWWNKWFIWKHTGNRTQSRVWNNVNNTTNNTNNIQPNIQSNTQSNIQNNQQNNQKINTWKEKFTTWFKSLTPYEKDLLDLAIERKYWIMHLNKNAKPNSPEDYYKFLTSLKKPWVEQKIINYVQNKKRQKAINYLQNKWITRNLNQYWIWRSTSAEERLALLKNWWGLKDINRLNRAKVLLWLALKKKKVMSIDDALQKWIIDKDLYNTYKKSGNFYYVWWTALTSKEYNLYNRMLQNLSSMRNKVKKVFGVKSKTLK